MGSDTSNDPKTVSKWCRRVARAMRALAAAPKPRAIPSAHPSRSRGRAFLFAILRWKATLLVFALVFLLLYCAIL